MADDDKDEGVTPEPEPATDPSPEAPEGSASGANGAGQPLLQPLADVNVAEMLAGMLMAIERHVTPTQAAALVDLTVAEQPLMDQICEDTFGDSEAVQSHPWLIMYLQGPDGKTVRFVTLKPAHIQDPAEALHFITPFALILEPLMRMVVRGFGYTYRFVQAKQPPEEADAASRIILP